MSNPSQSSRKPLLLGSILVLLLALPVAFMAIWINGIVSGSEFSPDDFTKRDFEYIKLPLLGITVRGIEYDDTTSEVGQTLITDGLISKPKTSPKTWHLCDDSGAPDSDACDARFLVGYLELYDWNKTAATSTPYWVDWNSKYPKSARCLWPVIADLARNEMYLSIPTIMRYAMTVSRDQPVRFQRELFEQTAEAWLELGRSDFQQGNLERAVRRLLRAQMLDDSKEVAGLLDLCRNKIKNFKTQQSAALLSHNSLKSEVAGSKPAESAASKNDGRITAEATNEPAGATDLTAEAE